MGGAGGVRGKRTRGGDGRNWRGIPTRFPSGFLQPPPPPPPFSILRGGVERDSPTPLTITGDIGSRDPMQMRGRRWLIAGKDKQSIQDGAS